MRLLFAITLVACGSPEPASEPEPTGGADTEGNTQAAALDSTRLLVAYQARHDDGAPLPDSVESAAAVATPADLAVAVDLIAVALAEEGSRLVDMLHQVAASLRSPDVSDRDVDELVDMAISFLWQLMQSRADGGAHPAACDVGRTLAIRGVDQWRAALTERFETESLTIGPEDYELLDSDHSPCDDLGGMSEAEHCEYRRTCARAHWTAFAPDGPLAQLRAALVASPAETVAALETHLDDSHPVFSLISATPRSHDLTYLGPLCAE